MCFGVVGFFMFIMVVVNVLKDLIGYFLVGWFLVGMMLELLLWLFLYVVMYVLLMGILCGVLLVFGWMLVESEIMVMWVVGFGLVWIVWLIYVFGVVGMVCVLFVNFYFMLLVCVKYK